MNIPTNEVPGDYIFDPIITQTSALEPKKIPKAAGRFRKIGKNAQHQLTIEMRRMKADLGLTTRQLVNELTEYEKTFGFSDNDRHGISRDFIPMNPVLMSSYLQGWVLQQSFIEAVHERLSRLYAHKLKSLKETPKAIIEHGIQAMFSKWFKELGIADKLNNAPIRTFAKIIAPYYKRPVTVKFDGIFRVGDILSDIEQSYTITDCNGLDHHFLLNLADEVLLKSGDTVKRGDIIQYSVLYPLITTPDGNIRFDTSSPSADHTTFFRWYATNKPPRSIQPFALIEEAVIKAKAAMSSNLKV